MDAFGTPGIATQPLAINSRKSGHDGVRHVRGYYRVHFDRLHQCADVFRLVKFPAMLQHAIRRFFADLRRRQIQELPVDLGIFQPVLRIA